MASVTVNKNKKGEIVSFRLRQYKGRNEAGKEYQPYTITVKMPEGLSKTKQKKYIEAKKIEYEEACKSGFHQDGKLRFDRYAAYVMKLKKRQGVKRSTLERYEEMLGRINKEIGFRKLTEITPVILNKMYMKFSETGQNKRTGGGLAAKTILEHHNLIQTILETAYKEGYITYNPAHRATPPKVTKKDPEFFSLDELHTIMDAMQDEPITWKSLVYFLILSGCRRGEALGVKWEDIDEKNQLVRIDSEVLYSAKEGTYPDTTKTDNSVRSIKLPKEMFDLFRQLKEFQDGQRAKYGDQWHETGYVWTRYRLSNRNARHKMYPGDALHPDSVNDYLKKHLRKALAEDKNIHSHMFRHSLPSALIPAGISLSEVSKMLGHANPGFTAQEYTHIRQEYTARASDAYSDLLLHDDDKEDKKEKDKK